MVFLLGYLPLALAFSLTIGLLRESQLRLALRQAFKMWLRLLCIGAGLALLVLLAQDPWLFV